MICGICGRTLLTEEEILAAKKEIELGCPKFMGQPVVQCHACRLAQDILDDSHEEFQKARFQRMNSHEFCELE